MSRQLKKCPKLYQARHYTQNEMVNFKIKNSINQKWKIKISTNAETSQKNICTLIY